MSAPEVREVWVIRRKSDGRLYGMDGPMLFWEKSDAVHHTACKRAKADVVRATLTIEAGQ